MAAITISAERVKQVNQAVAEWVSSFNEPSGSTAAKQKLHSVLDPKVKWSDHAFCVTRVGAEAIMGLHKAFLWCNQPFHATTNRLEVTASGAVVELVWTGRTANDIVRPDGEIAVKATGRDFVCHVLFLLDINEDGKITDINEYYNKQWDANRSEAEYVIMRGASLKSD